MGITNHSWLYWIFFSVNWIWQTVSQAEEEVRIFLYQKISGSFPAFYGILK